MKHLSDTRSLGERLADAREYLGVSSAEVQTETGILVDELSKIEANQRSVDDLELGRLERLYGYPVGFFHHPREPLDESTVLILARLTNGLTRHDRREAQRFAEYLRDASEH